MHDEIDGEIILLQLHQSSIVYTCVQTLWIEVYRRFKGGGETSSALYVILLCYLLHRIMDASIWTWMFSNLYQVIKKLRFAIIVTSS